MRQYESIIVQRESEALDESLTSQNARTESLSRVGRLLRAVVQKLYGEDVRAYEAHRAHVEALAAGRSGQSREASSTSQPADPKPITQEERTEGEEGPVQDKGKERANDTQDAEVAAPDPDANLLEEEADPETRLAVAEWSLERETELCRLEYENKHLRELITGKPSKKGKSAASTSQRAVAPPPTHRSTDSSSSAAIPENATGDGDGRGSDEHYSTIPRQQQQQRLLGGRPGTVGPFGTYKKSTGIRVDNR